MKYKEKKQISLRCPYCGNKMILKRAEDYFGDKIWNENRNSYMYVCKNSICTCYILTYKGSKVPRGIPADGALRKKRIITHKIFDDIWKSKIMTKKNAYKWLQDKFALSEEHAHISMFSDYMCDCVIRECKEILRNNHILRAS